MSRRGVPKAMRADVEDAQEMLKVIADALKAEKLSERETDDLSRYVRLSLLLEVLSYEKRGKGRPTSRATRSTDPNGVGILKAEACASGALNAGELVRPKRGRGRQRQYPDGFEYEVRVAVDQAMEENGGTVREAIMFLLNVQGLPTSEQRQDFSAMRALYYRAKRAKAGDL